MFFTLIIPAFNADQMGKLLYSIVRQNELDLQVIICDDSESDGVYRVYNKYNAYLNLVYCKTDKHKTKCPGNTRYDGMKHISKDTKYVLFADDDDFFEADALPKIKRFIIDNNYPEVVFSNIYKTRDTKCNNMCDLYCKGQYPKVQTLGSLAWLHGNLYRYDFLYDNRIEFKEDLISHEDVYFNCSILAHLHGRGITYATFDEPFYNWVRRDKSLSNTPVEDHTYIEKYLYQYIYSSTEPMFDGVKIYPDSYLYYRGQCMGTLVFSYFYYQFFIWSEGENILNENIGYIRDLVYRIMNVFNITKEDIINLVYTCPESYNDMKIDTLNMGYKFVETTSFRDFILKL